MTDKRFPLTIKIFLGLYLAVSAFALAVALWNPSGDSLSALYLVLRHPLDLRPGLDHGRPRTRFVLVQHELSGVWHPGQRLPALQPWSADKADGATLRQ